MPQSGMSRLIQRLSSLGTETFGFLQGKSGQGFLSTITELCKTLLQLRGEAASVAIAEEILALYREADAEQKIGFFRFLHDELGVNHEAVAAAIAAYQAEPAQGAAQDLAKSCEAARRELLRTLNTAPGGTQALIDMREDLHKLLRGDPIFDILDREMLSLFQAWFNRGFLQLRSIDWNTPALILEKLIHYESVHEIHGWPDLRRRLASDRGCFGFFHPAIPDVPLIFVEAALTRGMSSNVTELLKQEPPVEGSDATPLPDTAVFYSINNCLQGLRGVSFGNFLIKQVIERLVVESPHIQHYVTLSPIPGFMRWLKDRQSFDDLVKGEAAEKVRRLCAEEATLEQLEDKDLRPALLTLCAHYLVNEKSRGNPADAVARFHLGNGARLERINWLADSSANGLRQSAGLMVNYVYDRKQMARNHEAYHQRREVVCAAAIRKLLA